MITDSWVDKRHRCLRPEDEQAKNRETIAVFGNRMHRPNVLLYVITLSRCFEGLGGKKRWTRQGSALRIRNLLSGKLKPMTSTINIFLSFLKYAKIR
jgi:hypothetical protein